MCFCAFYAVSTPLIPPAGGAAAATSRAVQYARLWSATPQRPYWPDTKVTACDFQERSDRDVGGGVLADSVVEA